MYLKLITCASGQTCQFATKAAPYMPLYFCARCGRSRPSMMPMDPMKSARPIGAMTSWSHATRCRTANGLIWWAATPMGMPISPTGTRGSGPIRTPALRGEKEVERSRSGKRASRNLFQRPIRGPETLVSTVGLGGVREIRQLRLTHAEAKCEELKRTQRVVLLSIIVLTRFCHLYASSR